MVSKNTKINIIDPSKDPRWDNFVLKHKYSTVYHHSVWKELLEKTFNHITSIYFILEDDKNNIVGGIPLFLVKSWLTGNRLVSVPFASVCIPLVSNMDDFKKLAMSIADKLEEYHCSYFEMRIRDDSYLLNNNTFKRLFNAKNHVLFLDKDLDSLKKSFHPTSIRQRIKRAERDGLSARVGDSEGDMKTFYKLLSTQRQKKFGMPPQPYRIFRNMWKLLHPKGMLVLHLIEYRENVIAGMLVLTFNKIAISEHAASDSRYLKHSPNQLLWWKAIEHSHQERYVYFDMGKSYENTGLIDFKRRWQPREYNIYHLFFPEVTGVYSSNSESRKRRVVNTVLRHLPLPLARMGGYYLYKHMG